MDLTNETLRYALLMLAAGIGVPVLATMNSQLGTRIASPAVAASCLFAVAFLCAIVVAFMTAPQAFSALTNAPKHLFLGGVLIAFYLLSITWVAPKFGIGNAVFVVLLGQLISAAAIDHFALMGAKANPLTPTRAAGIALMAAGVLLTQRA